MTSRRSRCSAPSSPPLSPDRVRGWDSIEPQTTLKDRSRAFRVSRMIKTLSALLAVAALIGGCGGSSSSSSSAATPASSSATTAATTANSATSSAAASSSTTPSGGSSIANNPAVKQAVAACKQRIAGAPTLSADAKSKLTTLCDKAASGDEASVLKAAAQVCQEIVKQSVPQ